MAKACQEIIEPLDRDRNVIQCLITFDFWVTDLDRCRPVWNTVIESLVLDQIVANPLTGF